jgi:hypothetical protein
MKLNEVYHLIIYCLNCIGRDQNSTYKTDLKVDHHLLNRIALKAGFHCGRFVRAGRAGFENLLTRAWRVSKTMNASPARAKRTLMANGLKACFIRRISVMSNAIQTMDNEMINLINYASLSVIWIAFDATKFDVQNRPILMPVLSRVEFRSRRMQFKQ